MPNEIWLIRHAETEWSIARKHTGRTDIPLTDKGRERAAALRARLAGTDFAHVFTSPLSRARNTAELAGFGEATEEREALLEWDYGEYEGLTTKEIRESRPDWFLWTDGAPGGESPDEVTARIDGLVDEITTLDGNVALFAHGHSLRAFAARWTEAPITYGGRLKLDAGAVCILGFEREVRVIRYWNLV